MSEEIKMSDIAKKMNRRADHVAEVLSEENPFLKPSSVWYRCKKWVKNLFGFKSSLEKLAILARESQIKEKPNE